MDVSAFVGARGFATVRELRAAGLSDRLLAELTRDGVLRRPRRGIYTRRPQDDPEFRAVALGGRLTGASALASWGAWLPRPPSALHVAVRPGATGVGRHPGVVLHWVDERVGGSVSRVSVSDSLVRVVLDEDLETAVAALDWALSTGRLDRVGFESVLNRLPREGHRLRAWVDPRSQSVLESVARVRCLRRGWRVRSQVRVAELQSIDRVIEDAVALELDGRRFHEATFSTDRRKDLAITIEGRHAIRVDAGMLFGAWPDVERAIESALRSRFVNNLGTRPPEPRASHERRRPSRKSSERVAVPPRE